ncbi:P-loop ATPase, Sll1717 family [Flavobacterium sp. PL002]|uniref:P-loop ATPase, Sll1717 family n=1 Tax=Flavobacterium sp. PL002 TaxID=1897058 RepID=UPI0017881039|nr:hypothetical protein [Flavobacterium sp. PL002]MBE0391593.1 hypothetical protein [Flavobacterium sp. PL002]
MTISEYLNNIGFKANPFQFSNADKETEFLSQYFIKPDYFEDIWGNPYEPVSSIIYAPRGAGKTAQRVMIEKRTREYDDILAISYTNHDLTEFKNISEISLTYHLTFLNRLLLVSLFKRIESDNFNFDEVYTFTERQYIYKIARIYLYNTPASFPNQAISSLKTIKDRAVDIWNGFKEPITNVIKQITKSKGLEIDLSKIAIDKKLEISHKDNFFNIIELLIKANYNSIFILVDETNLTGNNPEASYRLIEDLLKDLELLETPRVSFKFFLWDALKPYTVISARPDRVFSYELNWDWQQISSMLDKRVEAYSNGKVKNFLTMFSNKKLFGRIILFSDLSPRDCIRICNRIISEQFKKDQNSSLFDESIVHSSIEQFCMDKTKELITNENNLRYLIKTEHVSFTIEELVINKVASDVAAVRNIINPWQTAEYLKKIGIVPRKAGKAVNEYAFQDIRIAFTACPKLGVLEFITQKVRRCKTLTCKNIFYRDFNRKQYLCPKCNTIN